MLGGRYGLAITAVSVLMLVAACTASSTTGEMVESADQLVAELQADGFDVQIVGPISQPFFDLEGQVIGLDGQDVQVFEFSTEADATSATEAISPDGSSVGLTLISWVSTPHFYQSGKLVVLYVGIDEGVISTLQGILGQQIAGG